MFRSALTALAILASSASAMPSMMARQSAADIQFCTEVSYDTGACPYAQPTAGAGTCSTLSVNSAQCYTFDDFPDAPSELIGDVNYISIPNGTALSGCNLYKTLDCTVTADEEFDSCEIGSTDLTCRKHLTGNITSWMCS